MIYKELLQQPILNTSLKIRFDYTDGSFEELLGRIEEGKIHFRKRQGFLDLLITYKTLIMPLPYITIFIGINDWKNDNIVWFNQGIFRITGDYSYTDFELNQLHFVALNDNEKYKECVRLHGDHILDNDFIQGILISESEYYKDSFYITTKLCPFANNCSGIMFQKKDSKDVSGYNIESFRHDLKNGTTKWELSKI